MQNREASIIHYIRYRAAQGQALVEYSLLLVLIAIAFGVGLAAAGPVIGNIFDNTVNNLVSNPSETVEPVGPNDFWLTVTAIASVTPREATLPPRTLPPPTLTPTDGPSPTASPVTPTAKPLPSNTPFPSPTPIDDGFLAPHIERVDEPEHWRVASDVFLSTDDWTAEFYEGRNFDNFAFTYAHAAIEPQKRTILDWEWGNDGPPVVEQPWPPGSPGENYSVRFTRDIHIDPDPQPGETGDERTELTVAFTLMADDGVRFYLFGPGQNKGNCPTCLLIDDWENGASNGGTVVQTIPANNPDEEYQLMVEYYQATGGGHVSLSAGTATNPDDAATDGSDFVCNWGRADGENANSLDFMWEEYAGGDFDLNALCHLEFRGFVYIPTPGEVGQVLYGERAELMENPEFVFWDVWDMQASTHTAYLEIAEYIPLLGTDRVIDRDATWTNANPLYQRIDLHQGASTNYNWTRNQFDLSAYVGKKVTFRFAMETNGGNSTRNWYIDDVEVRDNKAITGDLFPDGTTFTMDGASPFDPNRPAEADFITSPQWAITTTELQGNSWELLPGSDYTRFTESPSGSAGNDPNNHRIHYVEIDRWLNKSGNAPDDEGDVGPAVLSFATTYEVRRRVGLQVQYRLDGSNTWLPIPSTDPNNPDSELISITNEDNNLGQIRDDRIEYIDLSLDLIPQDRFRVRFAMQVRSDASRDDGWWIDDIRYHREDPPRYTDYEFFDDFEAGLDNWRVTSGDWDRVVTSSWSTEHSITDSPDGNYFDNTEPSIRVLYPFDFNDDTPRDPNEQQGNTNGAAQDPVMTFYHWRELDRNDDFYVEYRTVADADDAWKTLWVYEYGMRTNPSGTDNDTARQYAWEYVFIELEPILRDTASNGDLEDDDIYIRFRIDADGGNTDDGVYVDDVFIGERDSMILPEVATYKLWPESEDRTIAGTDYGPGDSMTFVQDVEGGYVDYWQWGGEWEPIQYEVYQGLSAFHESPNAPENPDDPEDQWIIEAWYDNSDDNDDPDETMHNSFQVLELVPTFDMRATAQTEEPTLYFWNRYHVGNDDEYMVQVSTYLDQTPAEMDTDMESRCGAGRWQCYEQQRGWSPWQTVWEIDNRDRNYTWVREQVSLVQYASSGPGSPGERIRIRFVVDAYDNGGNNDGWYLDNVTIEPRRDGVLVDIADNNFFDDARNLNNWVTEGNWGLSPQLFLGGGGGPAVLGAWQEYWWNCDGCSNNIRRDGDNLLDNDPNGTTADATRFLQNVNYDLGRRAPRPGVFDFTDKYVGRWVLETPVIGSGVQAGEYSILTISDDGVRVKLESWDGSQWASTNPDCTVTCNNDGDEWNIIYNWTNHGRTGDQGVLDLQDGGRYRITLEYYEAFGDSVIIANLGGTNYSFTDSPRQFAGGPDIPAQPHGNSSLILDGTLDLTNTQFPILQYYTTYESDWDARVEVSSDGGFTWGRNGMQDPQTTSPGVTDNNFDDPRYGYDRLDDDPDWELRRHNLMSYNGNEIMIRFRFDRRGDNGINKDSGDEWFISWWIEQIRVVEAK